MLPSNVDTTPTVDGPGSTFVKVGKRNACCVFTIQVVLDKTIFKIDFPRLKNIQLRNWLMLAQ